MDREEEERLALGARQLIDSPAFEPVIAKLTSGYVAEWTEETDPQKRDALWCKVRVLQELRGELRAMAYAAAVTARNSRSLDKAKGKG